MRTITNKAIKAFNNGVNFRLDNTQVNQRIGGMELVLHGHTIAKNDNGFLEINLCGWNTPTTRERLNGLNGVSCYTRKGQAFLNGNPIPSDGWVKVA